ncbi:T9SS type B sorting domain-containing protein [Flavobacterium sp. CYK-4]|uniref:T9SS type B sorting domain-containing protein n=1 Tax=Flavobacterium lotistagni TaxID=2709660 RepID=UPI00140913E1|nr:gliding motility-associated C-terminal domain-containing protein [Flavobacterium lotistagni]NHM07153.1 T9SS type B sorting domain-containing protein [Flavobacterium lotistagni]
MRALFSLIFLVVVSMSVSAQCGGSEFCNGNTGLYSNDDAANIAYDNIGSGYHSTYIKEPNSQWRTWGANMRENGSSPALSPMLINTTNYTTLTGTIYKIALGSWGGVSQIVVLTSDGLFVGGYEGAVISNAITNSSSFNRITVDGKADGLPIGVSTDQIKMLFVTTFTIILTTCIGEVYVLSIDNNAIRGNGNISGLETRWYKVMQDPTTPLSGVIVARGNTNVGFALKSDGTLWTWGHFTYLGDGSNSTTRNYATQMTLPPDIPAVKMIQSTNGSYYVLGTNKKIYSLGNNDLGQLGDRTTTERTVWVNAKNPDNSVMTDAVWISANEHDVNYPSIAVIKTGGLLYTAGSNSYYMIGRQNGINHFDFPSGIQSTDVITHAESGGHSTAVVKLGSVRYGYVGHRIDGSMGDGSSADMLQQSFDFITPPIVAVCGTLCEQPTLTTNSPTICSGTDAIFTISGTPGDIVTYSLNGAASQTVSIGANGSVNVTVPAAIVNQNINLSFILGGTGDCSNFLSMQATIGISNNVTPTFTQVPPICSGATLDPLPTTSNNGITGTWSPPVNNQLTTTYTFTPSVQGSCITTATMTINVPSTTVPSFNPIAPVCAGISQSPLPTTSLNGINGTWSPAFNNQQTTTYSFTPTEGSCIDLVTTQVVVKPTPTPVFVPIAPICEGSPLLLPTISTNGITGVWSPATNNAQATTYTFSPTSDLCAIPVQMTVNVNLKATPDFTNIPPICFGDTTFSLPTISNNGISGTWSPAFSNTQTKVYLFTPNPQECAFGTSKQVAVFDDFDFALTKYCQSGNLMLEAYSNFDGFDIQTAQFDWQMNNLSVGNASVFDVSSYIKSTSVTEVLPLEFSITVTSADGCPKTKSIAVESIYCSIQKGISPNNDGLNEFFDLRYLDVAKLSIYNRYGTKVYSKNGYKDQWHGQSDDNGILPDATYYYVIDFEDGAAKTGWIYINNEH